MPIFKRLGAEANEGHISETMLPTRGSDNPAFVEMVFSWEGLYEADPRYRSVILPDGFAVKAAADSEVFFVLDQYGYPRARIKVPARLGPSPTISPVRRFDAGAEKRIDGWRMVVFEWGVPVVRGSTFSEAGKAQSSSEAWLDQHRRGWRGYTSYVNFQGPPPKWT